MVSIIIPCYNQTEYVAQAIESVKNQTYNDWECIIVNDGSTDDSEGVILECISNDNRFIYLKQDNKGPGNARNNGASIAKGYYMTMLDADDLIGRDYLQRGVKYLDEHPRCTLYYGVVEHFDKNKTKLVKPSPRFYWQIFTHNQFNTTCLYRKEDYDRIGGYNEELENREDWEFYIRLLYRNRQFFIDDVLAFRYRHHENHRNIDSIEANDKYFKKIMELNPDIYEDYLSTVYGKH